jgi:hypothetical protein
LINGCVAAPSDFDLKNAPTIAEVCPRSVAARLNESSAQTTDCSLSASAAKFWATDPYFLARVPMMSSPVPALAPVPVLREHAR